jgi:hypothetical protein
MLLFPFTYFLTQLTNVCSSFAYAEMRTVSANLLSRFSLEEAGYQKIQLRQFITMQFHDGKWRVVLKPRWKDTAKA